MTFKPINVLVASVYRWLGRFSETTPIDETKNSQDRFSQFIYILVFSLMNLVLT